MPLNWSQLRNTIQDWAEAEVTPSLAIWADQNAPRPKELYVSIKIISGPTPIGIDERRISETTAGEITVVGNRQITLSVNVYAPNTDASADPMAVAEKLQLSLSKQSHMDNFQAKGIAVVTVGPIRDVTTAIDSRFEKRANFDSSFSFQTSVVENVGWIEKINSEGTFQYETRTVIEQISVPEETP